MGGGNFPGDGRDNPRDWTVESEKEHPEFRAERTLPACCHRERSEAISLKPSSHAQGQSLTVMASEPSPLAIASWRETPGSVAIVPLRASASCRDERKK